MAGPEPDGVFYVLVTAVPVTAVAALFALTRAVDAAALGRSNRLARVQAIAMAAVLGILVLATAVSSPLT